MASILRVTTLWSSIPGAPGYTHFHWGTGGGSLTEAADAATAAVRAFWQALIGYLPSGASLQVQQECPLLDETNGHLNDVINATAAPAVVTGTGGGNYAAPAGCSIIWLTGELHFTHRLRGRTYIVPGGAPMFEANGTLAATAMTAINTAATTLRNTSAVPLMVWGRPHKGGSDGLAKNVIGHSVRDKAAVLRSRRD